MGAPDASSRRTFSSSATAPPPTAGCPTAAVAADDARASAGAVMFEEVEEAEEGSSESAPFPGRGKSGTPVRHQDMYAHLQVYGDSVNTTTLWRQAISIELSVPAAALVWPRSTTRTAHKKLRSPPRESRLATARASSHGPALTLINRNNDWRELLPRLAIVGGFVVYSTTLTRNTFEVEWQVQDLLQNNNDDPLHHLLLCGNPQPVCVEPIGTTDSKPILEPCATTCARPYSLHLR